MDSLSPDNGLSESKPKTPVVRGARACTVCRTAKMRCVGAEDGQKQCQRCKRQNLECVFEKHRRGRKPGSKLSEASKMLRRLEKGINTAKLKAQASTSQQLPFPTSESRTSASDGTFHMQQQATGNTYTSTLPPYPASSTSSEFRPPFNQTFSATTDHTLASPSQTLAEHEEEEEEDNDKDGDDALYPQRILAKENRNSFFGTILNPSDSAPRSRVKSEPNRDGPDDPARRPASTSLRATPSEPVIDDPVSLGLLDEAEAKVLFDLVFLRLNPFINLFDPVLHTVPYVRQKCPLLFSCLLMAGCKFWKPELFKQVQKIAVDLSIRSFAENWKRVEVVQAFACLTYWKDPDDTRTWTYIGYACRMAVEIGLNRHVAKPSDKETDTEKRERRNRERTYLVLFVHDRSLSMQTGRQWMLPEDDLVRHSMTWHEDNSFIRPEDVIVAAFVQLRRIAAETTDVFYLHKGGPNTYHADVNYEILLRGCNGKLTAWMDTWQQEMKRAGGQPFHYSMLSFFRLHVRLFLNSFGLQSSMSSANRSTPSLQALSACYTSALQTLQIITKDFAPIGMLRYTQESITVMTAYSAVFLLKLLRRTTTLTELNEGAAQKIYDLISQTADAYQEAAILAASSSSAAYHARFLRTLVHKDQAGKARAAERERKREADEAARRPSISGNDGTLQSPTTSYNQNGGFRPPSHPPPASGGNGSGGPNPAQGLHTNVPVPLHQNPGQHSPSHPLQSQSPEATMQSHTVVFPVQQPINTQHQDPQSFQFTSPRLAHHPMISPTDLHASDPFQANMNFMGGGNGNQNGAIGFNPPMFGTGGNMTELDAHYWRNMFRELGFGANMIEPTVGDPTHMEHTFTDFAPQNFGQSASMGMLQ